MTTEIKYRRASGLVRSLGALDTLNLNVSMCSPPQGVLWAWTWGAAMFPGALLSLSYFLGIFAILPIALIYVLWTIAMPRSGGDYVWLSRAYHPIIGFMVNFFLTFVMLNWYAMNLQTTGPFFLASFFTALGYTDLAGWVSSFEGSMIIGIIFLIIYAVLILRGMRFFALFLRIFFVLSLVGSAVFIVLALLTPTSVIMSRFMQYTGMSVEELVNRAVTLGFTGTAVALLPTLMGLIFPFQNYSWAAFPSYIAGEIKEVKRNAWIGIIGGLFAMGAWYVVLGHSVYMVLGYQGVSALSWLYQWNPDKYPLPFAPYPQNYAFFMTDNVVLIALIAFGWLASGIYLTPPNLLIVSRNVFAWAVDGLLPQKLREVKWGSPIYSVVALSIITIPLMYLVGLASYQVMIVNTFFFMQLALIIVALGSALLPYRKKELLELMPGTAKKKIGNIYMITIIGLLATVLHAWVAYSAITAPALGGLQLVSFLFNLAIFLLPIPLYIIVRHYRLAKEGIDINLLYKEVPVE
ncbi:APC family permease [Thermofilum sp.]|jgi:amino acid transporter|uniref:APC family permease n=1 Tax=Thermofilum sp. TaxID=1961369 RepID=UPI002590DAE9|nr:APC family permease [Thermofilum sp.]